MNAKFFQGLTIFLLSLVAAISLAAQTEDASQPPGRISGIVVDADSGQPILGATILVTNTEYSATTDLEGRYILNNMPPGVYRLSFFKSGYRLSNVTDVEVKSGSVKKIDFPLPPRPPEPAGDLIELEAFTVTGTVLENSDVALMTDRQKSNTISDAIGAEAFSRMGLGDASEAMSKVTGATIQDGKHVFVRGLGDRYSNTLLNGNAVPSSDPDKRSVHLDQFPTSLLDKVVTSKSFTPDQPGSFSGGSVNIVTKSFPDIFFLNLSAKLGYNSNASLKDEFLSYPGGDNDWLAMDSGVRELPEALVDADIPSITEARFDDEAAAELDRLTREFSTTMAPQQNKSKLDHSLSTSFGDQLFTGDESSLGYVFSLTYDRNYRGYEDGETGRYENTVLDSGILFPSFKLSDSKWTEETKWGILANTAYKFNTNHEVGVKFFLNQNAEDLARVQQGEFTYYFGIDEQLYTQREIRYTERQLWSLQASGKHVFEFANYGILEWRASKSKSTQDEPDLRYLNTSFAIESEVVLLDYTRYGIPSRYFQDLEEDSTEYGFDYEQPLDEWFGFPATLKLGASQIETERSFNQRAFGIQKDIRYIWDGDPMTFFDDDNRGINDDPIGGNPASQNFFKEYVVDLSIQDGSYDGSQELMAYYLMADFTLWEKWRFITGVRMESTDMEVVTRGSGATGTIDQDDALPAFHIVYLMNENMNVRLAYGKTLARGNFREMAQYRVFELASEFYYIGNPDLEMTLIDNFDLRWEWFFGNSEVFAVSLFYKDLEKPIEIARQSKTVISPQNAPSGNVMGIEFEFRTFLDRLGEWAQYFSVGGNFAYIQSEVDIEEDELEEIRIVNPNSDDTRPLNGQSDFVFNFDISYDNWNTGTLVTLTYNIYGERLVEVSKAGTPNVFEQPAGSMDLIISQNIGSSWKLKLSLSNLLDPEFKKTYEWEGTEYIYQSYKKGRSFSLSLSYSY